MLKDFNNLQMQKGNDILSKYIEETKKIIECLKQHNHFKWFESSGAMEELDKVTPETLPNYEIVVQKSYNVDNTTFAFEPKKRMLIRTKFTGHLQSETEENYARQFKNCPCNNPCYKGEYTVDNFIDLIERGIFEPIYFNKLTK